MKKDEVTTMLRSAVSNAAPDVLDNVLHACDHEKGKVIYMEKKKNRGFTAFAAVAAVFVLLIAGIFIAKKQWLGHFKQRPCRRSFSRCKPQHRAEGRQG